MFGNDNNQPQNDTTGTMGLASSPAMPSSITPSTPLEPSLSADIDSSGAPSTTDAIPQFIPPDANGHIQQTPTKPASTETDLMDIKKDALEKLGPLVDKLDQTPEEKFKTLMMMIQASDDQTMLPKAYDSANAISDEHVKARALLDIVNEINYFTGGSSE